MAATNFQASRLALGKLLTGSLIGLGMDIRDTSSGMIAVRRTANQTSSLGGVLVRLLSPDLIYLTLQYKPLCAHSEDESRDENLKFLSLALTMLYNGQLGKCLARIFNATWNLSWSLPVDNQQDYCSHQPPGHNMSDLHTNE